MQQQTEPTEKFNKLLKKIKGGFRSLTPEQDKIVSEINSFEKLQQFATALVNNTYLGAPSFEFKNENFDNNEKAKLLIEFIQSILKFNSYQPDIKPVYERFLNTFFGSLALTITIAILSFANIAFYSKKIFENVFGFDWVMSLAGGGYRQSYKGNDKVFFISCLSISPGPHENRGIFAIYPYAYPRNFAILILLMPIHYFFRHLGLFLGATLGFLIGAILGVIGIAVSILLAPVVMIKSAFDVYRINKNFIEMNDTILNDAAALITENEEHMDCIVEMYQTLKVRLGEDYHEKIFNIFKEKLISIKSSDIPQTKVNYVLGKILEEHDKDAALEQFKQVHVNSPYYAEAMYQCGLIYDIDSLQTEAKEFFQKAAAVQDHS